MKLLRNLLDRVGGSARFDRYYGDIVRAGAGYPTADEARKDMMRLDRQVNRFTWIP